MRSVLFAVALAVSGGIAVAASVDPAQPFGTLDLNKWRNAEYLSGTQRDVARTQFVEELSAEQKADLKQRCEAIMAAPSGFGEDVMEICMLSLGILNRHD